MREWLSAMRIVELCGAYELRLGDGRRDTELTVAIFLISLLNLIPSKITSRVGLALDVRLTTAGDVSVLFDVLNPVMLVAVCRSLQRRRGIQIVQ